MKNIINRNEIDFFEEAISDLFRPLDRKANTMRTDIKETENDYELYIDIPGFKKEEIDVELNKGYLTIKADKNQTEETTDNGYIRKERNISVCRSYYVGEKIKQDEIKAKYENGVLNLVVPKELPKKLPEYKIKID